MVTEERVGDGAVVEQEQDKSMAGLAKELEETGAGTEVLWYKEQEGCQPPRLSFRGDDLDGTDVEEHILELGYLPVGGSRTSYYQGQFEWSLFDYVMEFEPTLSVE